MVFSATFACGHCRLRFARRARCPSCGRAEIFPLATRAGRARYRVAARTKTSRAVGMVLRLAPWAPRRAWLPIGAGILLVTPAAVAFSMEGPRAFQNQWLMTDLTITYEGVSSGGFTMLGLAVAGALVVAFTILAKLAGAMADRVRPTVTRMRVFSPTEVAHGGTTLTGIARRASIEIVGCVSNEPCLLFGIRGEVGDADVADADGGDFDLELPSGERVMISLEHARLVAEGPAAHGPGEIGGALAELLEQRAIPGVDGTARLGEHLVCDGDEVTVIGKVLAGTVTSVGYRGATGARVLSGEEDHPLVVRASKRVA
jgi:hypothetical protein